MLRAALLSLTFAAAACLPSLGRAQGAEQLYDLLRIDELVGILQEEGLDHAADIEQSMFPGRGGGGWRQLSASIYDAESMADSFRDSFTSALAGEDVGPLIDFFGSERGRRIIDLELEARRAFLDTGAEEAAKMRAREMRAVDDPLIGLVGEFIDTNGLVEANVIGGMNGNLAFYHGLQDGGALQAEMDETEILNLVWSQEADIRADTTNWLFGYLALAYQPLPEDDLRAYIALSGSDAGRLLNRAIFAGFDELFEGISYQLGHGAAAFIQGQDI